MTRSLLWTTEALATRALAAEIRHNPERFVDALALSMGAESLGRVVDVRCEKGKERIDVAITFEEPALEVAIEAKFDHELSEDQVARELGDSDHLVVLLLAHEHAPLWLQAVERTSVMTWEEALACFSDSRLTIDDVRSARSAKSAVEVRLKALLPDAEARLGRDWDVRVERGDGGMPAINFYSPWLADGSQLRGVIQVTGYGMPRVGDPISLRFSVGTSVTPSTSYPADLQTPPAWVASVQRLRDEVIADRREELLLSKRRPSSAHAKKETDNGRAHARKLAIVAEHFEADRWLTAGYIDWIVGPASQRRSLDDVEQLFDAILEILGGWYRVEAASLGERSPA